METTEKLSVTQMVDAINELLERNGYHGYKFRQGHKSNATFSDYLKSGTACLFSIKAQPRGCYELDIILYYRWKRISQILATRPICQKGFDRLCDIIADAVEEWDEIKETEEEE